LKLKARTTMPTFFTESLTLGGASFRRRGFLNMVPAASLAAGAVGFRDFVALRADDLRRRGMSLILLWMQGGPSQLETFDPKPKTENGGPTEAIETSVPGIQIAKGWEKVAQAMHHLALVRSMTNKEGEHGRASYQMHTGFIPTGTLRHPSLGCAIAKEIRSPGNELPAAVSIGSTVGAGFLGVDFEPFVVQNPGEMPRNVASPVPFSRFERRLGLLGALEQEFADRGAAEAVAEHKTLYQKTRMLVRSARISAFEFNDESEETRKLYGSTQFGRGCLLARRLVEAGVSFVEVRSNGWDTHDDNFNKTANLASQVDPGMAALVTDLAQRGLLERTLVVWTGEFGRTPRINPRTGRDHFPRAFNVALAGAGIRGGQVYGATSADGMSIKRDPVTVADLFCTICKALQVDPTTENVSPIGRPLKIVDGGSSIDRLFS